MKYPIFIRCTCRTLNESLPIIQVSLIENKKVLSKCSPSCLSRFFHQPLLVHVQNQYNYHQQNLRIQQQQLANMGGFNQKVQPKRGVFKQSNHPKLKTIEQIKEDEIMRVTIPISNQSEFYQWEEKLNKVTSFDDEFFLFPKAYQFNKTAICGSSGSLQIDYDNYIFTLEDELSNRKKMRQNFHESELWYLLYSLISVAFDFKKINLKIGDVRPQNIFLHENGCIKVGNLFSWPGQVSNYLKQVCNNQKTYLSPQQIELAKTGKSDELIDKFLSESFSIGLTLLQSGLLCNITELYLPNRQFDVEKLSKLKMEWQSLKYQSFEKESNRQIVLQYSIPLKIVVSSLCSIQSKERVSTEELYDWLNPFEKQIVQLQPFTVSAPPIPNLQKYLNLMNKNQTKGSDKKHKNNASPISNFKNDNSESNLIGQNHFMNTQKLVIDPYTSPLNNRLDFLKKIDQQIARSRQNFK